MLHKGDILNMKVIEVSLVSFASCDMIHTAVVQSINQENRLFKVLHTEVKDLIMT